MKKKIDYYEEDGVEYWTLVALSEHLGIPIHKVWNYRKVGALIRVNTEKGLYFRLAEGWKVKVNYYLDKAGSRKMTTQDWAYTYSSEEMMQREKISYEELVLRTAAGVYHRGQNGTYLYLTDKQWSRIMRRKGKKLAEKGWDTVAHGDNLVYRTWNSELGVYE